MCKDKYSDIVMDHFMCPRNVGIIVDANGKGSSGDKGCGDSLDIYIKVENDLIEDISFLVYGCPASIATSSMTTELVKGKTIEQALNLTENDIINALGGLPENKKHCSMLGIKALKNAINSYLQKSFESCIN